jgi:Uma2 family endonuclease
MSTTTTHDRMTAEQFLKLPDSDGFELVDGQLVERQMGAESSEIAARIIMLIGLFLRTHRIGRLFGSDTSYQCFVIDDEERIRRADVSFVRTDRLPNGRAPKGQIRVAPDLAIEVVSPNDTAQAVDEKVMDWLAAGAQLVWLVTPSTKTVRIHRPRSAAAGPVSLLSQQDTITGEDVLPGFTCALSEFFENV